MTPVEIAAIVTIYVMVGCWEYVQSFQLRGLPIRYEHGFAIFALIGWVLSAAILIQIFGFLYGLIAILLALFLLPYITHFTLGALLNKLTPYSADAPLAVFSVLVWILFALNIALFLTS